MNGRARNLLLLLCLLPTFAAGCRAGLVGARNSASSAAVRSPQPGLGEPQTAAESPGSRQPGATGRREAETNARAEVGEHPVRQVALQQPIDGKDLELPPAQPPSAEVLPEDINGTAEAGKAQGPLTLDVLVAGVYQTYPQLQAVFRERQIADGKQLAAWGAFDLNLKGFSIAGPLGFYETYRHGFALEQPTFGGGYVYGGYKLGRGNFQPWYKERDTNEGGEFSVGLGVPILKNRAIDARRADLLQSQLARDAVEPGIQIQVLDFTRVAAQVYWTWVAAGRVLKAQEQLLALAQDRVKQIEERVDAGDLERIVLINNQQLIASRETKVIEAQRKLQQAAIKLSLFLLTPQGEPVVPGVAMLPAGFPDVEPPHGDDLDLDIQTAISLRPEISELDLFAQQVEVDLAAAQNSLLPKLDAVLAVSQDVGAPADSKRDKSPLELEAGVYAEVPLQRRAAQGKIHAAQGKLAQLRAKRVSIVNKISAEVRDSVSALEAAAARAVQAQRNVSLAQQTLSLGREQFNAGDLSLVDLNIYEQSVTDAQFLLIAAYADYYIALADYRAALARDPIGKPVN